MKLTIRLLGVSLRQAFASKRFWLAGIAVGLMLWLPCLRMVRIMDTTFGLTTSTTSSGASVFLLALLPAVPLGCFYATEYTGGAVPFWTIRAGVGRYIRCKFTAAVLAAMGVYLVGALLGTAGMVLSGVPFLPETNSGYMFAEFVDEGRPLQTYIFIVLFYMITAACWTAVAVFLSTCVPNVYITLAGPSFFFIFCVWLGQYWPKEYEWCSPKYWGEHFYDAGDPYRSMLLKAGVTLAVIIVLGAASVANGKRRQRNA